MQLINYKVEFSSGWYEECILPNAGSAATFTITDAKRYVPIVTLRTEDNTKLSKLLSEGFKRPIYWNKYKVIFRNYNNEYIRERIDASFQGVNKLFVLPYASGDNITDKKSYTRYFLPRIKINYNIEIDCDDYTTGCLLDFAYFEKNYKIIAADLSKQKALDADSRAIQLIIFTGHTDAQIRVYYILEQLKETMLEFSKGTAKVL